MPSTSKKQHNFMAAIANNPLFAKKVGIPQSVGKDFDEADKGRKFGRGGTTQQRINKQDTKHGKLDLPVANLNRMAGMKGGGSVRKFKEGGTASQGDVRKVDRFKLKDMPEKEAKRVSESENTRARTGLGSAQRDYMDTRDLRDSGMDAFIEARPKATIREYNKDKTMKYLEDNAKRAEDNMLSVHEDNRSIQSSEKPYQYKKGGSVKESKGMMGMKGGGMPMVKKGGKMVPSFAADGKGKMNMGGMAGMKHGGMHKMPDGKMMKDSAMKKMNMGGMSKYAKGGGIESRGKTKGTMIRMATGGSVSSASRRVDGIAQRGKTKLTNY